MTPHEAADRLFNRVMAASEQGNTDEARRFTPMALSAYAQLGTLDNDARYHVALIHLVASDLKSARTELVKLRKGAPHHLLGYLLEYEIAERERNTTAMVRISKAFLAAYPKEIAITRSEYQDHHANIERFRQAAQGDATAKP